MNREMLDEILRLHDDDGVLSVYVFVNPAEENAERPGWRIRVDGALSTLVDSVRGDRLRAALIQRLDQLRRALDQLSDPTSPGRGRALFASLRSGTVHTVAVQDDWADSVDLAPVPHVIPLLRAWILGAPAGAAIVSAHRVRLVEMAFGVARNVDVLAVPGNQRGGQPELVGRGSGKPGRFQHSNRQTDLFARRQSDHITSFLRQAGPWIAGTASRAGWEDLLVAGEPTLASAVVDGLRPDHPLAVTTLPRLLEHLPDRQVARAMSDELTAVRRDRAARVAEQARDLALAGGPAAYGLAEVLAAIAEDRVAHLVLDADHHWRGRRAPDGRLMPEDELPPGISEEHLVDEPLLADRIAVAAARAGAQVTVLDGLAPLRPADGIAAILRW